MASQDWCHMFPAYAACDSFWVDRKWVDLGQLKKGLFIFRHYYFNFLLIFLFYYAHRYTQTCAHTRLWQTSDSISQNIPQTTNIAEDDYNYTQTRSPSSED